MTTLIVTVAWSKLFQVTNINFANEYNYNWLYYAYFSPIWKERFAKYNYRICNETKQIIMNPPRSCYIYVIFPCHAIYMKILTVGSDGQKYIDPWKHKVLYWYTFKYLRIRSTFFQQWAEIFKKYSYFPRVQYFWRVKVLLAVKYLKVFKWST